MSLEVTARDLSLAVQFLNYHQGQESIAKVLPGLYEGVFVVSITEHEYSTCVVSMETQYQKHVRETITENENVTKPSGWQQVDFSREYVTTAHIKTWADSETRALATWVQAVKTHKAYWGRLSREKTNQILESKKVKSWLIRKSENAVSLANPCGFVLSCRLKNIIAHSFMSMHTKYSLNPDRIIAPKYTI
jgi:hypothetical protein